MGKHSSLWGKFQIAFFVDGDIAERQGERTAVGLINYRDTPSTIYLFPCWPAHGAVAKATVANLVGRQGVTPESPALVNATGESLGALSVYCDL